MMKHPTINATARNLVILGAVGLFGLAESHAQIISFTFEGILDGSPVALDSIHVMNLTQGGDTTVYFPDNALLLGSVGTGAMGRSAGLPVLSQPNPFLGSTEIVLHATGGELRITLHDAMGRELAADGSQLAAGAHRYRVTCAMPGVHILSVVQGDARHSLRLMATEGAGIVSLLHAGASDGDVPKSDRSLFTWAPGDVLRYIGYATSGGVVHSAAIDEVPVASTTHTFVLTAGAVCPDSPTVTDIDGNAYRAVQVGGQCWMAENLRTGTYNTGTPIPHVTGGVDWVILSSGAWCNYENNPLNDVTYGKLYNGYAITQPNLCPMGWHVPTDLEWQTLESSLGMPTAELDLEGDRGWAQNVGGKLKSTLFDTPPNAMDTNETGMSCIAGGTRDWDLIGDFILRGAIGCWWTSTGIDELTRRGRLLVNGSGNSGINRPIFMQGSGLSVRCVRD